MRPKAIVIPVKLVSLDGYAKRDGLLRTVIVARFEALNDLTFSALQQTMESDSAELCIRWPKHKADR